MSVEAKEGGGGPVAETVVPRRDLSAYKEEQIAGGDLAAAAYMLMWAVLAAWLLQLTRRQASAEASLRALEARIDAEADAALDTAAGGRQP